VAVDAGHIYWATTHRHDRPGELDGTGVNQSFITTDSSTRTGVAVDADHILLDERRLDDRPANSMAAA